MRLVRDTGSHFDLDEESSRRLMDEVLSRPLFAHLATASAEGPRESPVWFLWEDGALWIIGSYKTDSFPKRIEQEPRCAVGIVDFNVSTGLVQHVGFRGRARLEPHDAARMRRLLGRYMGESEGWDARFIEILDDTDYIFVRFEPETAVVRDQSYHVNNNTSQTPLHELWNERGSVRAKKLRDLNVSDVAELLRAGKVHFVVANVGSPLRWIPIDECYGFWKSEVKSHLADPAARNYLEDLPDEYCYFASEWEAEGGEPIVLLTMSH